LLGNDLLLLIEAARRASNIALPLAGGLATCWEKEGNEGPVTEADISVNEMLVEFLRSKRPDYGWLSEESEDNLSRLEKKFCFIIDPIDGTRSFISGKKTWAHSFAITKNGLPTAAVVYLPAFDALYAAQLGKGAFLNEQPISVSGQQELDDASVLAGIPAQQSKFWKNSNVPNFSRHHRPSLAYRLALVADGSYDAMITFRKSWEWDICAGSLIAAEAGATVSDRTGNMLSFNQNHPFTKGAIAAPPTLHTDIIYRSDAH